MRTRLPIAAACLAMAAACGGPGTPSAGPSRSASPGATAGPAPSGEIAASPEWRLVPRARTRPASALLDVAATGPDDAWAAGYERAAEDNEGGPALQHWDGERWKRVKPPPGAVRLTGVAARGPRDAWVVGHGSYGYAAHWDGERWTAYQPFGVAAEHFLTGVAVTKDVTWMTAHNGTRGQVVGWDGRRFRLAFQADGQFLGVSATGGHVWAVGTDAAGAERGSPMVWHGKAERGGAYSWQRGRTPDIPGGVLQAVWAVSPSQVWAVGTVTAEDGVSRTPLVLRSDGEAWWRVPLPVAAGVLGGVTALADDDVWISGVDAAHPGQVLILRFDGGAWTTSYGPLMRREQEEQQYPESDQVGRATIAPVPGTSRLWVAGAVGWGDDEDGFFLGRG
ncbi:hypothetical protein [Sphaerisporangium rubeum]|uniref:Uncharacterized protein n=1 Tax=Sphaerisporangium rubeum TaxID=321317 RepID=A0A7X0IHR1_9ACTN|nr:hypothetical protein [Sphaerisporangium rubeum]MBB6475454.1 hypothetical protein [Sphaerisporangium rubeum]